MKILRTIETEKNARGLCALSSKIVKRKTSEQGDEEDEGTAMRPNGEKDTNNKVEVSSYIAYPHGPDLSDIMICEAYEVKPVHAIRAHKSTGMSSTTSPCAVV